MARKEDDIQKLFNEFLQAWDSKQMVSFIRDIEPLFDLFNVEENDDWVKDSVSNKDEVDEIRMIRAVYLISRICEFHAGKLVSMNIGFKGLWKKLEKIRMLELENSKAT